MKVKVYAKLNLTLNVTGRENGFHNIDSVATSVDVFDVVEVTVRNDCAVNVCGMEYVNACDNSAYKAACGFINAFNTLGVDISIDKRIPFGAGMGGSSADAAAVIYCMCSLFGVDVSSAEVHGLCASVGSDVSFMLCGGLARLRGKGDDVIYYEANIPLYFALTTFNISMSTAEVYSQFDNIGAELYASDNGKAAALLEAGQIDKAVGLFNNHLQAAASSLSDYAADYIKFCNKHLLPFNMTGSGSAYYIAFDNEEQARNTAELLNGDGFKAVVCKSVPRGIVEV